MSRCIRSGILAWATVQLSGLARSTGCVCCLSTTMRTQEKPLDTTPKYSKQNPTLTLVTSGRMTDVTETSVEQVRLDEIPVRDWVYGQSTLLPGRMLTTVSKLSDHSSPNAGSTRRSANVD